MTLQEILIILQERSIIKGEHYNFRAWRKKENAALKELIEKTTIKHFSAFAEKMWYFSNFGKERPVCNVCGKDTAFLTHSLGFRSVCSQTCSGLSTARKQKIIETSITRHGVKHPTQSLQFRNTIIARDELLGYHPGGFNTPENRCALVKKYGVENVFQSDTIKAQIETTFKNRYGVRNAQQVKEIRNRTRISNIEKYGQDGWNPEQTKKTMQEKYGVDYPLQSPAIREKIRLTSQARYGTDSPMQNAEIFERCQRAQEKARYRFKQVELPSGDVRWAQGYEPQVINYLLQSDISETDLKTDRTDIPVIRYFFENRERIYFPDIFIPSKNMLIEVKSGYTWVKDILKNLAKHDAAKNAGFRHLIVIWDDNKNNIKELIN